MDMQRDMARNHNVIMDGRDIGTVVLPDADVKIFLTAQPEDRAHRIGQKDSLLCYYLVSPHGSDRAMQDALGLKISQFVGLMGDAQPEPEEQLFAESQAREHILALVDRLLSEQAEA